MAPLAPNAPGLPMHKGWLDDICSHMIIQGSLKKRYIYAFEFPDYNSNNDIVKKFTEFPIDDHIISGSTIIQPYTKIASVKNQTRAFSLNKYS